MQYFNQAAETMPRERLQSLQLEKLRALLSQISGRNRFYSGNGKRRGLNKRTFDPFQISANSLPVPQIPL